MIAEPPMSRFVRNVADAVLRTLLVAAVIGLPIWLCAAALLPTSTKAQRVEVQKLRLEAVQLDGVKADSDGEASRLKARRLRLAGELEDAERKLEERIAEAPENQDARVMVAKILGILGALAIATSAISAALVSLHIAEESRGTTRR
jgi:hypothetical protein